MPTEQHDTQEGISTTSGWLAHRLGGFPKEGDVLSAGAHELHVLETEGSRINRLQLRRTHKEKLVAA